MHDDDNEVDGIIHEANDINDDDHSHSWWKKIYSFQCFTEDTCLYNMLLDSKQVCDTGYYEKKIVFFLFRKKRKIKKKRIKKEMKRHVK